MLTQILNNIHARKWTATLQASSGSGYLQGAHLSPLGKARMLAPRLGRLGRGIGCRALACSVGDAGRAVATLADLLRSGCEVDEAVRAVAAMSSPREVEAGDSGAWTIVASTSDATLEVGFRISERMWWHAYLHVPLA